MDQTGGGLAAERLLSAGARVRTRNDLFISGVPRLPEILQSAGYRTAAVSTIGNVSSALGYGIGFDRFVDLYKEPSLVDRREVSNTGAWKLYFEQDITVVLPLAEDVNEVALAWLREVGRPVDETARTSSEVRAHGLPNLFGLSRSYQDALVPVFVGAGSTRSLFSAGRLRSLARP